MKLFRVALYVKDIHSIKSEFNSLSGARMCNLIDGEKIHREFWNM